MENINIRIAAEPDIPALVSLGRKTFSEAFADQNSPEDMQLYLDQTFTIEKLHEEFSEPGSRFFLAVANQAPVGYAKISSRNKPKQLTGRKTLELERLYVLQAYQNRKIGALLMDAALQFARQNQFEVFWLGVWEYNLKAQKFYRSYGFEIFGQHTFMLGTDAQTDFLMKVDL